MAARSRREVRECVDVGMLCLSLLLLPSRAHSLRTAARIPTAVVDTAAQLIAPPVYTLANLSADTRPSDVLFKNSLAH